MKKMRNKERMRPHLFCPSSLLDTVCIFVGELSAVYPIAPCLQDMCTPQPELCMHDI